MKENFDLARKVMVDNQIRPVGVTNLSLLENLGKIPREKFVPKDRISISYSDAEHQLSLSPSFLMAPASFARLAQLAQVKQSDIVLVVGCGTGYSVAVLAGLCNTVVGIEADEKLVEKANDIFSTLDIGNGAILTKDPAKGVPSEAPFDLILIEGEVKSVPLTLLSQLRDGGRLIAVINDGKIGKARIYIKNAKNISIREGFDIKISPLQMNEKTSEFSL